MAPEHTDPETLRRMHKPPIETFAAFQRQFCQAAAAAGKEQYLVPYFMAGHPGCDLPAMIDLALYLKRSGYRPDKVQDFIPVPDGPRHLHVLHGHGSDERPRGVMFPRATA